MVTGGNQADCDDYFAIYKNVKSLYPESEINIVF